MLRGIAPKRAMVTAIVTGGWTSIAPFLVHLIVLRDVPIAHWLAVLPGVAVGARLAPHVHAAVGLRNILMLFATFLVASAVLMFASIE